MYFNIIAAILPVLALGHAAFASPLKSATSVETVEVSDFSALKVASVGKQTITEFKDKLPQIAGLSATTANTGFHAFEPELDSGIFFCQRQNCAGQCFYYPLTKIGLNQCFNLSPPFLSVLPFSSHDEGYPFALYVGLPNCDDLVFVPEVNECYNTYFDQRESYFYSYYAET